MSHKISHDWMLCCVFHFTAEFFLSFSLSICDPLWFKVLFVNFGCNHNKNIYNHENSNRIVIRVCVCECVIYFWMNWMGWANNFEYAYCTNMHTLRMKSVNGINICEVLHHRIRRKWYRDVKRGFNTQINNNKKEKKSMNKT